MNANILSILNNLISQKTGGHVTAHSNSSTDGLAAAEESNPYYTTTDNSTDKSGKSKHHGNPRFNDTLQKKMHPESPQPSAENILTNLPKKEKASVLEKIGAMVREMPYPACVVSDQTAKKPATPPGQLHLKSETPQIAPLKVRLMEPAEGFSGDIIRPVNRISPETTEITNISEQTAPTEKILQADPGVAMTEANISKNQIPSDQTENTPVAPEERPQIPEIPVESRPAAENSQEPEQTAPKLTSENRYTPLNTEKTAETANDADKPVMPKPLNPINIPQQPLSTAANPEPKPQETLPIENEQQKGPIITQSKEGSTVVSHQAFVHKMNVSMEQINTLKDEKAKHLSESKDSVEKIPERLGAETSPAPASTEKPPVSAEPVKVLGPTHAGMAIGRQIQETVSSTYRSGSQQIVIRLDPPELGRVTIRFIEQRDGITGLLHVDKSDTRQEIQQALPEIVQNLQQSNVQIRKIEVVLNQEQQFTDRGEHFNDSNESFDQHSAGNSHENAVSATELSDILSSSRSAIESTLELTDKSINILI